ncbi:MarR family transcriptional regulator [Streptomyces sp. NPDC057287]|uniref:MarR family transcriptional regulator n=1 Tax=Streptomyces sp. NPDC057287 TaxID=3346086 RepID=UPI00363D3654
MAIQHLSSALSAPASSRPYPMAHPGYGKRSAPDQQPRRAADFSLLPLRERSIAGFIDHLPEGAAMDVKGLAKQLPLYGQQAVASALKALSVAGYLRRVRCLVGGEGGQVRWVFRTFWSRTARDNEWWAALVRAGREQAAVAEPVVVRPVAPVVPQQRVPEPDPSVPEQRAQDLGPSVPEQRAQEPAPAVPEGPSPAYAALARLGRVDARLALSAADCAVLEPLAAEWFARGVDADYLKHALSAGLPEQVDSPVGFVRCRLAGKLPPQVPAAPEPPVSGAPVPRAMMECTECGAPGRPGALTDGLCRSCRLSGPEAVPAPEDLPAERDVRRTSPGFATCSKRPEPGRMPQ